MSNELVQQQTEVHKISRDPLDEVEVGKWYWVKFDDMEWKKDKKVKVGEHEELMCVGEIGSNYVGFNKSSENHFLSEERVHFNEFFARCRVENNWKEYLKKEMDRVQLAIQEKTKELIEAGKSLYLLPSNVQPESKEETGSLLPVKVADEPKKYKKALVKLKDKTLPVINKEIEELSKEYAVIAKDMALPDVVKLNMIKSKLGVVEDKIFTIELYCGLQEDVVQIADGEPAGMEEKVAIRQQMLYMDEETLFDYESGGMDFNRIGKFDAWVVKPENLNRILPEKKGIVAFRVRRNDKDYGESHSIGEVLIKLSWKEANEQTYLLIRNGQRVYRIASSIDFSPRLIPMRNEIGEEQFKKINGKYGWSLPKEAKEEIVTPEDVEFDDHVKMVDDLLRQYNRIVIILQGLLDRSKVFHPHPPINLTKIGQLDEWVRLIRDEEDGLPCNRVTWEEYRKQLNSTLDVGKWIYIRYPKIESRKYGGDFYYDEETHEEVNLPRRAWTSNAMPKICQIKAMRRDGSKVKVSWPKGELSRPKQGKWVDNPKRPGWGHYESIWETDQMLHEWVPTKYVLNVSDYNLGDYKMFLCDHALKGQYLKWAPFLLSAEEWGRRRANGVPVEEDKAALPRK